MDPRLLAHVLQVEKMADIAKVGTTKDRLPLTYSILDALDYLGEKIDANKSEVRAMTRYTPTPDVEGET